MIRLLTLCLFLAGCSVATASPAAPTGSPDTAGVAAAPEAVFHPSGDEPAATYGGTATWYCSATSPCTRGYGPGDMVAAIDPTLGIPKGTRLRVTHDGRSVNVTVVDVCACGGARIIDLTSGAFQQLAPLSRGVIDVAIEERTVVVQGRATLPPTDIEGKP